MRACGVRPAEVGLERPVQPPPQPPLPLLLILPPPFSTRLLPPSIPIPSRTAGGGCFSDAARLFEQRVGPVLVLVGCASDQAFGEVRERVGARARVGAPDYCGGGNANARRG